MFPYLGKYRFRNFWVRVLMRVFDVLSWLLLLRIRPGAVINPDKIRRILIVRGDFIGDVVMTTAVISPLAMYFPSAKIDFALRAGNEPLVQKHPAINKIWPIPVNDEQLIWNGLAAIKAIHHLAGDLRREKYDLAIDFKGHVIYNLLVWLARVPIRIGYGDAGGSALLNRVLVKNYNQDELAKNIKAIAQLGVPVLNAKPEIDSIGEANIKQYDVVIHPGSYRSNKQWPIENYLAVATWLACEHKQHVVIVYSPQEAKLINKYIEANQLKELEFQETADLVALIRIIRKGRYYLGNDSGPLHIAVALKIPSLGLFGPEDPAIWHPYSPDLYPVLTAQVPCRPCTLRACPLTGEEKDQCLNRITVDDVVSKLDLLIQ